MIRRVVVLDYGVGNTRSAVRAFERIGAEVELTAETSAAAEADGLVIPGVGAFHAVMAALETIGAPRIVERRLAGGRGVLGICVGMQVMFARGQEHGRATAGIGLWPDAVTHLDAPVVPHMGWSTVSPGSGSALFDSVESERFYFVHSYAAQSFSPVSTGSIAPPVATWSHHGVPFVAAVEDGPMSATQFHPEKSGDAGAVLLENWLNTL